MICCLGSTHVLTVIVVLDRVTGENTGPPTSKDEEADYLSRQLASAAAESERRAAEKQEALRKSQESASNGDSAAVRAKYLEKLNALKSKAKTRTPDEGLAAFTGVAPKELKEEVATKGLTTWLVNKGANEMLVRTTAHSCRTIIFV